MSDAAKRLNLRSRVVAALVVAALGGCNEVSFPDAPPDFRGISVPIPPPSLTDEPVVRVEIDGTLGTSMPIADTRVYLYEKTTARGYFVLADGDGDFILQDVLLDLRSNCMQVWAVEPGPGGEESQHTFFKASIAEDDVSVDFEEWKTGC